MPFEERISEHYKLDLIYASERKEAFLRKKDYLEELISIIESDYWNDKGVEFHFFCCNSTKVPTFIEEARYYLDGKNKLLHIEAGLKDIENLAEQAIQRCGVYRHQALADFLNYINTPENRRPLQFAKPHGLKIRMQIESDFSPLRNTGTQHYDGRRQSG